MQKRAFQWKVKNIGIAVFILGLSIFGDSSIAAVSANGDHLEGEEHERTEKSGTAKAIGGGIIVLIVAGIVWKFFLKKPPAMPPSTPPPASSTT